LKRQNGILSESNDRYEDLNDHLNDSIAELKEQNEFLAAQVDLFSILNQDLNATMIDLTEQVDRLEGQVSNFTLENDRLENLVGSLSNETDTLTELSNVLQSNVDRLEGDIATLEQENGRLDASIADLKTVIEFWGDVSGNFDDTYEEMAAFLAQQIETNRFLVLEALQNTYHQRVGGWDCALRDQFAMEPFANDDSVTIPGDSIDDVLTYVDERVLSDLCLDKADFEKYLEDRYSIAEVTVGRLATSVQRYTWSAIDHYFPEDGETGLSAEDWATAEYDCGKLASDQKYVS
jgi:ABC-type transporter Mla subunit MlaD